MASTALLGLGGWLVIDGQLTLGQLVAAELIVTMIVGSFAKLGKHMESYYDLMASVDKLGYLFDIPMERHTGLMSFSKHGPASVEVCELQYSTSGHAAHASGFSSLNLTIPAGATAVIPTTDEHSASQFLDVLFGLRAPQHGYVLISGVDPRELRPDILRRAVALVRDVEVFEGSVAQNIHLERPDVSPTAVREVLQAVGLLDEMLALPRGLETPLNCTGAPLTRGQLHKLMLARAIVGRPSLLLIDGALDGLSDADLKRLMELLCGANRSWTLILTTGRKAIAEYGSLTVHWQDIGTGRPPANASHRGARHAH